jgi:hypothetical protein
MVCCVRFEVLAAVVNESCHLLGYSAVKSACEVTFRRNVLPSHLLHTGFLLGGISTLRWMSYVPLKRGFAYGASSYIPGDGNIYCSSLLLLVRNSAATSCRRFFVVFCDLPGRK